MITRTFHPIGQGAFYTEKHDYGSEKYNIVYDCGSTSLDETVLKSRIKSCFKKNEVIDILFISHFHDDHINGIEFLRNHCKIKSVVVPFLSEKSKAAHIAENNLLGSDIDPLLINNPAEYFGPGIFTITIKPYNEGNANNEQVIEYEILEKYARQELDSATKIRVAQWIYVPFNFKQEERATQFEEELSKKGIILPDLREIEKLSKSWPQIIEAYNEVDGELNENSLILFSGPINNSKPIRTRIVNSIRHWYYQNDCTSCLYTGDYNAKSRNSCNALVAFINRITPQLGTLQIPHHGSIKNFSEQILDRRKGPLQCIISVGNYNTYGHPSHAVINRLADTGNFPIIVTESIDSYLAQIIYFG